MDHACVCGTRLRLCANEKEKYNRRFSLTIISEMCVCVMNIISYTVKQMQCVQSCDAHSSRFLMKKSQRKLISMMMTMTTSFQFNKVWRKKYKRTHLTIRIVWRSIQTRKLPQRSPSPHACVYCIIIITPLPYRPKEADQCDK